MVMFIKKDDKNVLLYETSNQYGVIVFSYDNFVIARSYRNYEKLIQT